MTRYERVQQILDEAIGGSDVNIGIHGAFRPSSMKPIRQQDTGCCRGSRLTMLATHCHQGTSSGA